MSSKRFLTIAAWGIGAVSVAGFAVAWILAARNGDLSDIAAWSLPRAGRPVSTRSTR